MIGFAAALTEGKAGIAAWLRQAGEDDRAAALRLLSGQRPRRVAGAGALMVWSAEAAGVPEWLAEEAFAASGDRAEVAALLVPDPVGTEPGLAEVVAALERATRVTAPGVMRGLWAALPAEARVVVNRLAAGTFRVRWEEEILGEVRSVLAVMIMASATRPEVTLALWSDGALVPVATVMLDLPEVPEIMDWVRAQSLYRFGPKRQVPPEQVFRLEFAGLAPNPRRKCGFDLVGARVLGWRRDMAADQADALNALR